MNTLIRTHEFDAWLKGLKDVQARLRIISRIMSAQEGNFGDCEPVGEGISEMRIFVGPGYRVYYTRRGEVVYLLLCGGNKASDYLNNEDEIAQFLTISLEDPNPDVFLRALQEVAKARGMTQLAKDAGINRESLYKALAPGAKPRYDTVLKLVNALGVKLTAQHV